MSADGTFFQKMEVRWEDVLKAIGEDGSIPTKQFVEAARGLCKIFDMLQNVAFSPVKSDMERNVSAVETRYKADPEKNATLQQLVHSEKIDTPKDQPVTRSLLWFKRGMEFLTLTFSRSLTNITEELSKSFSEAYSASLSKHHNMLTRPIFHLAVKACPNRATFYKTLGVGDNEELLADMKSYFDAYGKVTAALVAFYNAEKLEDKP